MCPLPMEHKEVFGVTFEQGRQLLKIDEALLQNIVTENKELPESAKIDLIVALITLKYTQSNSVCYVKDGQAIGVGAGQQSRIHCTRLAGNKADNWWLRQHPKVLGLQFVDGIRRPDRDNAIDVYISDEYEDVLADGVWQETFKVKPEVLTREEKKDMDCQAGPAWPWAPTPSSPSATTWSVPASPASSTSLSRAAPSGTTTSSKPATTMASPCASPASVCSTIDVLWRTVNYKTPASCTGGW